MIPSKIEDRRKIPRCEFFYITKRRGQGIFACKRYLSPVLSPCPYWTDEAAVVCSDYKSKDGGEQ